MKRIFILCATLLLATGCQETAQSYRFADPVDALGEKLFQLELKKRNIVFEVSKDGLYVSSPSDFERLVAIGKEVNDKFSRRSNLPIDEGCSSKKLLEWLRSRDVVFVEISDSQTGRAVSLSAVESDSKDVMNQYAGFHFACVRSGGESEYNKIWKQDSPATIQAKPK